MTWQFTLTGLLIGALVGLTGMGGGSLLTPILVIVFGFKPTLAVGTDVLHGAIFKSFGAVRHRRLGTVHARLTLWMFLGSGPMSLLGVAVATWLDHRSSSADDIEAYAIGAALVVGGAGLVAKTFVRVIGLCSSFNPSVTANAAAVQPRRASTTTVGRMRATGEAMLVGSRRRFRG